MSAIWLLVATGAHGQTIPPWIDQLAADPFWLKLLHYHDPHFLPGAARSEILTPEFFLSPQGAQDPKAELAATIAAFRAPAAGNPDQDARCRFPARLA